MNQISNVSNVNLTLRPGVPAQVRSPAAVCVHHVPSAPPVIPPPGSAPPGLWFPALVPSAILLPEYTRVMLQKVSTIHDSSTD